MGTRSAALLVNLWVLAHVLECITALCAPHPRFNITSFGENCTYQCHCVNNVQCDAISGECPTGCARGWMGPGCQYRNLSPKRVQVQNHPGTGISSDYSTLAVDGDLSTCCRTGTDHNNADNGRHFWRIELKRDYFIVGLKLYIKPIDKDHFRGFRVEVGPNNTRFPTMCYEHPDIPGEEVMEVMCTRPVVTRHLRVILHIKKIRLSLCEVEIYGGRQISFKGATEQSSTYFWEDETEWISSNAVNGRPMISENEQKGYICSATKQKIGQIQSWTLKLPGLYRIEGIDVYSFAFYQLLDQTQGFSLKISKLEDSKPWMHNDTKMNDFSKYLPREVTIIPPVDGQTIEISKIDILALCEVEVFAECLAGWCGLECSDLCHCSDVTTGTYRLTGVCPYGCEGRWTGPDKKCNHECKATQWGPYCNNTCGKCHGSQICDVRNGQCPTGCAVPGKPPLCAEECDDGTFGQDCNSTCGNCTGYGPCNKVTGRCDHGCEPGLQLPDCKQQCIPGSYGPNCMFECGYCNNSNCSLTDGTCPFGCHEDYEGNLCQKLKEDMPLVVIALVGGVLTAVVATVGVALFICRRRRSVADMTEIDISFNTINANNERDSQDSEHYCDIVDTIGKIRVLDLRTFCDNMKFNQANLIAEFMGLKKGLLYSTDDARKQNNKNKNMFKEMYPYDKNRVHLPAMEGHADSDYINASYIMVLYLDYCA